MNVICRNKGRLRVSDCLSNKHKWKREGEQLPAGQDTSFTNMCCEATCWHDGVAREMLKIKARIFFFFFSFL